MIVKQILLVSNTGNIQRTVWGICILMLECKGFNFFIYLSLFLLAFLLRFSCFLSQRTDVSVWKQFCCELMIPYLKIYQNFQDREGWKKLSQRIGEKCFIVGSELYRKHFSVLDSGVTDKLSSVVALSLDQANTITGLSQMARTVTGWLNEQTERKCSLVSSNDSGILLGPWCRSEALLSNILMVPC